MYMKVAYMFAYILLKEDFIALTLPYKMKN